MWLKIRLRISFNATTAILWIRLHFSTVIGIALCTDFIPLPTLLTITSLLALQWDWTPVQFLIPRGTCDKSVISPKVPLHSSIT